MSPLPKIDFSDIKGPEPVPADDYILECMSATEGTSKAGNPKIALRFRVVNGQYEGRNIFDNLTFTEASLYRIKQFMIAAGFDPEFAGVPDPSEFVGKIVQASVVIRKGGTSEEGEIYSDSNSIKKFSSAEQTDIEDLM